MENNSLHKLGIDIGSTTHKTLPIQAVQYHPEASPGPTDNFYLFKEFVKAMEDAKR